MISWRFPSAGNKTYSLYVSFVEDFRMVSDEIDM
jgi:hypothetical protein